MAAASYPGQACVQGRGRRKRRMRLEEIAVLPSMNRNSNMRNITSAVGAIRNGQRRYVVKREVNRRRRGNRG
jgi:hypothetical protein